jgi:hypothetical protein
LKKLLRYLRNGSIILLSALLLLYIIAVSYVTFNKKKIISQVTQEVSKKINGKVTIGNIDLSFFSHFPSLSVVLKNVSITDSMLAYHHHPFFKSEKVYVTLGVINLIKKRPPVSGFKIEKGSFYLFTDTSGYSNNYLFKPRKDSSAINAPSKKGELSSISMEQVRFTIDDRRKQKFHDLVINNIKIDVNDKDPSATLFFAKADILVKSLAFNLQAGSFIKEKTVTGNFNFRIDKNIKQLQFDSINLAIGGHPFNITGRFDLVKPDPQFSLRLHTRKIPFEFGKSLFTQKIIAALSIVGVDEKLDADADITGPLKGGDPLIYATWSVKDTHLKTPFIDFDHASFNGYYSDEVVAGLPRKDPNSKVVISNFSARWQGFPITSDHIEVFNLTMPVLTCHLLSQFPLTTLNDVIGSNSLQLQGGDGSINLNYKGPIEKNNNTNSFVNGVVSFKDGNILYAPRDVEMKNVNGLLIFKNSDVFIQNLQCNVLNNKIVMDGEARNLLTLINTEPNKVRVNYNIYSPSLNLASFTYLLKSRKKVAGSASKKNKIGKVANIIDKVLDEGSLDVTLKAGRLLYKKFDAQNVTATLSLLQDSYILNNVNMQHAGGNIALNGSLITQQNNNHLAKLNVNMDNVDVSKVFNAFDNFGQDGITAQNLDGKLSAKVNSVLIVDDNGKVLPGTIESVVDFSLKNGALTNYEPVKKMQNFLFKNRDFDNIRFAELKDRLEIKNQEVKINRMEIQSNVISIFVEGIYSKRGNTDMSIQIPLSNIKKRDADYRPENVGTGKRGGSSIYLRGRPGPDGSIKFKLDLFHKFKKDKEKAEEKNQEGLNN